MFTNLAAALPEVNPADLDALIAEDAEYLAWLDANAAELAEDSDNLDRIAAGAMPW